MRWLWLLLVLPAAAAGYYAAIGWRAQLDRRAAPGLTRPPAVERLLRAMDDGATSGPQPTLTAQERAHPWAQLALLVSASESDPYRAFADEHRDTAPGARALQLWTRSAATPGDRARRRATFREHYPHSWIHRAWNAEAKR